MTQTIKIRFTEPQIVLVMRAYPNCNLDRSAELSFEIRFTAPQIALLRRAHPKCSPVPPVASLPHARQQIEHRIKPSTEAPTPKMTRDCNLDGLVESN